MQQCRVQRKELRGESAGRVDGRPVTESEKERYVEYGTHEGSGRVLRGRQRKNLKEGTPAKKGGIPSEVGRDLCKLRKFGYNRVTVMESSIKGAGDGLFCTSERGAKDLICSYEGERLSKEQVQEKGRNLDYVFGMKTGEGREQYIDALATHSCFGRFANDQ